VSSDVDAALDGYVQIEGHNILAVNVAQKVLKTAVSLGGNSIKMQSNGCGFGNNQVPVNHVDWPPTRTLHELRWLRPQGVGPRSCA
jgi:murein endopeptidase